MSDSLPPVPGPPVEVPASPTGAQSASMVRAALLLLSGAGLLGRFLTPAQMAFLTSDAGVGAICTVLAFAGVAWGQLAARRGHLLKVFLADAAPDAVAAVIRKPQ